MINSKKITTTIATLTGCIAISTSVFASNFKDIENHWGKENILNLTTKNIINGYSDSTFRPDNTITRAEFSKLISTALKIEDNNKEEVIFSDIEKHWAEKKIESLTNKNIIDKKEYKEYKADENITRIEIAKMAVRALKLDEKAKNIDRKTSFKDDDLIKKEDKGYVILAVENKIVNGYTDETFRPSDTATRAEASKMIVSLLESIEKQKTEAEQKQTEVNKKNKKDSSSKEPEKEKTKEISIEDIETQKLTMSKTENVEILNAKDIKNISNSPFVERYKGVIKTQFPSKYKFEFKDLDFEGKTYLQVYCDEFIEDGFEFGEFFDKEGNSLGLITRIGGFKSDLFDVKQDFRPYFSLGLKANNLIERAEYIAFEREANYYMKNAEEKVDKVLVIFENPFKKN